MRIAEYIWIDGTVPTKKLRSKFRVLADMPTISKVSDLWQYPEWGFDGSSTSQSPGENSDLPLKPVRAFKDPIRGGDNVLVLCEVPYHPTNTRAPLMKILNNGVENIDAWFGFEQEYTMFDGHRPLGWPKDRGVMPPQGPYYCGVGADEVFGRALVEEHACACLDAGLKLYGGNAEVMPGQWEFQIGFRPGIDDKTDPLEVADHLWVARWLLYRLGENHGIDITIHPKPLDGDWNGAGMHTNFSTKEMRSQEEGPKFIESLKPKFEASHNKHILAYGANNSNRLTGLHETCSINQFRWGERDRGASIRVPDSVANNGYGYLEDRRPAANADPYEVCARILKTICDLED